MNSLRAAVFIGALLLVIAVEAWAGNDEASTYVEFSGEMFRDSVYNRWGSAEISPGDVRGSLYNKHPSRAIRVTEITVTSSRGRRVIRVDCQIPPQEFRRVQFATGLYLDFTGSDGKKDSLGAPSLEATWVLESTGGEGKLQPPIAHFWGDC
jgi:hypothetical protein